MVKNAFALITPGEMLKDEFLAAIRRASLRVSRLVAERHSGSHAGGKGQIISRTQTSLSQWI
jgi:hypothetical protein